MDTGHTSEAAQGVPAGHGGACSKLSALGAVLLSGAGLRWEQAMLRSALGHITHPLSASMNSQSQSLQKKQERQELAMLCLSHLFQLPLD